MKGLPYASQTLYYGSAGGTMATRQIPLSHTHTHTHTPAAMEFISSGRKE